MTRGERYTRGLKRRAHQPKPRLVGSVIRPGVPVMTEDEADIRISEVLVRTEKPIPLKKVLKEFGRGVDR